MNTNKEMTVKAGTIARTICLFLALVNQLLSAAGHPILPIEDAVIETIISNGAVVVAALAAWWKNNSFTKSAIAADQFMAAMKKP